VVDRPIRERVVVALIQWMRSMPADDPEVATAMLRDLKLSATADEFIEARARFNQSESEEDDGMPPLVSRKVH
jgi:hypothetical protein